MKMLDYLAIAYLQWKLRRDNVDDFELVIRNDGCTYYKRNKYEEQS